MRRVCAELGERAPDWGVSCPKFIVPLSRSHLFPGWHLAVSGPTQGVCQGCSRGRGCVMQTWVGAASRWRHNLSTRIYIFLVPPGFPAACEMQPAVISHGVHHLLRTVGRPSSQANPRVQPGPSWGGRGGCARGRGHQADLGAAVHLGLWMARSGRSESNLTSQPDSFDSILWETARDGVGGP